MQCKAGGAHHALHHLEVQPALVREDGAARLGVDVLVHVELHLALLWKVGQEQLLQPQQRLLLVLQALEAFCQLGQDDHQGVAREGVLAVQPQVVLVGRARLAGALEVLAGQRACPSPGAPLAPSVEQQA